MGVKSLIFAVARKLSQVTGKLSRVPGGFSQVNRGYISWVDKNIKKRIKNKPKFETSEHQMLGSIRHIVGVKFTSDFPFECSRSILLFNLNVKLR